MHQALRLQGCETAVAYSGQPSEFCYRKVFPHITDIPFPVCFFCFPKPVLDSAAVRMHDFRHLIIVTGFISAPNRFSADKPQHSCHILQIIFGIRVCGKCLLQEFYATKLTQIFTIVPLRINRWLFCVHMFLLCSQPALYLCILT